MYVGKVGHRGQNATTQYYTKPTSRRGKQDPIPQYGHCRSPCKVEHLSRVDLCMRMCVRQSIYG